MKDKLLDKAASLVALFGVVVVVILLGLVQIPVVVSGAVRSWQGKEEGKA